MSIAKNHERSTIHHTAPGSPCGPLTASRCPGDPRTIFDWLPLYAWGSAAKGLTWSLFLSLLRRMLKTSSRCWCCHNCIWLFTFWGWDGKQRGLLFVPQSQLSPLISSCTSRTCLSFSFQLDKVNQGTFSARRHLFVPYSLFFSSYQCSGKGSLDFWCFCGTRFTQMSLERHVVCEMPQEAAT